MNYSYVMGIDNIDQLNNSGCIINKYGKNYGVIFSNDKKNLFEKFIIENLNNGFWNEYLGDNKVFIFKFKNGDVKKYILSDENQNEILELCRMFANYNFISIEDMLRNNKFYKETFYKES